MTSPLDDPDDFYSDVVQIVRPVSIPAQYGSATTFSYDPADGAQIIDVAAPVDIQPTMRVSLDDQTRIATLSGWTLHTQPGIDIDLTPKDRVRCKYGDCDLTGEVRRWPSEIFESGIDHVEVDIELRTG